MRTIKYFLHQSIIDVAIRTPGGSWAHKATGIAGQIKCRPQGERIQFVCVQLLPHGLRQSHTSVKRQRGSLLCGILAPGHAVLTSSCQGTVKTISFGTTFWNAWAKIFSFHMNTNTGPVCQDLGGTRSRAGLASGEGDASRALLPDPLAHKSLSHYFCADFTVPFIWVGFLNLFFKCHSHPIPQCKVNMCWFQIP